MNVQKHHSQAIPNIAATGLVLALLGASVVQSQDAVRAPGIVAIVQKHCVDCHGSDNQEGGISFDKLTGSTAEVANWSSIYEQLKKGAMPPKEEPSLTSVEHSAVVGWIERNFTEAARSLARKLERPDNGNLIPHEKLFDPKTAEQAPKIAASPARLWRMLPASYVNKQETWLKSVGAVTITRERADPYLPAPFGVHPENELKNYSSMYTLEGSQIEGLASNARLLLIRELDGDPKDQRSVIRRLALAKDPPKPEDIDKVIVDLYRHWIGRDPEAQELDSKRTQVLEKIKKFGNRDGLIYGLVPIMVHPEAFFHAELGTPKAEGEATILPPLELANALDRALTSRPGIAPGPAKPNGPDFEWAVVYGNVNASDIFAGLAARGQLQTRADVIAALEHKRMPKLSQSEAVHQFLVEYFNYPNYFSVFKDLGELAKQKKEDRLFGAFIERFDDGLPEVVVSKTRRVIEEILKEDKQVLARLLTIQTDYLGESDATLELDFESNMARTKGNIERMERELAQTNENPLSEEHRAKTTQELEKQKKALAQFIERHPDRMAPYRMGVLTQRSWLVSYSTNTDNHAIHRGKWVRERLLGGRVPDVPITVDAKLPDDPSLTLREKMQKTRGAECWKCHQLMDPLGLPFEQYDHFGSFRQTELNRPAVTTGEIIDSGDPSLDGPVSGPDELLQRLAKSERVQQVFVRYAFRFWMGRNETLDDARTIQNAYQAYKESDGSMSALLKSLLTSDAFLYRTGALPHEDLR